MHSKPHLLVVIAGTNGAGESATSLFPLNLLEYMT